MQEIRAHFDGQVFVPDEPVSLPPDCEVTVVVRSADRRPLRELAQIVDSFPNAPGWPPDGAKEVDHYLYGHPKRESP